MDQKDEKPGQHQLLGGSDVPTTAKRFSTTANMLYPTCSRHKQVYRSSGHVRESTSSLINPSLRLCARTSSHFCVVGANLD